MPNISEGALITRTPGPNIGPSQQSQRVELEKEGIGEIKLNYNFTSNEEMKLFKETHERKFVDKYVDFRDKVKVCVCVWGVTVI